MGTGKSRIGWELSRRLQLTFIDTDRVIERVACMRISEIFELYGEATFRDYETEIVRRCLNLDEVVVSTGGGTVVREENRRLLRSRGPVVVLDASPRRVQAHAPPPAPPARGDDPLGRIRQLMGERQAYYEDVASVQGRLRRSRVRGRGRGHRRGSARVGVRARARARGSARR
jgi:shikimate kinase